MNPQHTLGVFAFMGDDFIFILVTPAIRMGPGERTNPPRSAIHPSPGLCLSGLKDEHRKAV
ncbi:hypothetical protein [Photorhabdus asymbiotica]|uniref:hypothetical protein n=1 Tax=Photorhabdus asymbiotica TaxID=291112 RepID=UPI003DA75F34